jgi:hypothetical protein
MQSFYQRHKPGIWTVGIILLVVLLGYIGLSLLSASNLSESSASPSSFSADRLQQNEASLNRSQSPARGSGGEADTINVDERQVIRNGSLELVVNDINDSANRIQDVAEQLGGFVASSRIDDQDDQATDGSMTIRVPADSFRDALNQLKQLAVRTTFEQTSARDVTDELTDLEARLRNARRTESQYLSIMEEANSVDDTLKVQERLSRVRERIERLEANQKQLQRQVRLATIDIDLVSEDDVEIAGVTWSPLNEIKAGFNRMMDGLTGFLNTVISLIFALPVIALWLSLILVILAVMWRGGNWVKDFITRSS